MRMALVMTHLWPGFLQVWMRGRWQGLVQATVFGLLLNLALITTFIWPELLNKHLVVATWGCLACVWIVSILRVRREISTFLSNKSASEPEPGLFIRAQAEYLRSNWFEAESLFRRLTDGRDDVEANLMLATLYRRTGREDRAKRQLQVLAQSPAASAWSFEIQRELELIERAACDVASSGSDFQDRQESGMPEAA